MKHGRPKMPFKVCKVCSGAGTKKGKVCQGCGGEGKIWNRGTEKNLVEKNDPKADLTVSESGTVDANV